MDSPPPPAGDTTCPLCSSHLPWIRSVKRKAETDEEQLAGTLHYETRAENDFEFSAARVGPGAEAAALREAAAAAAQLAAELEEERAAASSAASEAMTMIVRLQREKAEAQMEARQCRRFADERMALDAELAARREEVIRELSFRLDFYRRRLEEFGVPLPDLDSYPRLKCSSDSDGNEDLGYGETSNMKNFYGGRYCCDHPDVEDDSVLPLRDLEKRILSLEHSPRMSNRDEEAVAEGEEFLVYENEYEYAAEHKNDGKVECDGDDGSARVYTIDAVHKSQQLPFGRVLEEGSIGELEPDIKKLYARLETLEADRESLRQALVAVRTEKAQLLLLREIAQQLTKEKAVVSGLGGGSEVLAAMGSTTAPNAVDFLPIAKESSLFNSPPYLARGPVGAVKWHGTQWIKIIFLIKWVFLNVWKKKARHTRYKFGMSNENVGLMLLLEKSSPVSRRLTRT